ncbi:putative Endonuclease 8-like 1-like isoform X1 protein [Naja naja]|nr:putative Endonuclease 8-like 1-like isoform X1 protein [Naja naja]
MRTADSDRLLVASGQLEQQPVEVVSRLWLGPLRGTLSLPLTFARPTFWGSGEFHLQRMPEGPELFQASRYINAECAGIIFTGKVEKSEVSKNPEVPFESDAYRISAVSRGKELKLTLTPLPREGSKGRPMDLVFRFGMSGNFKMVPVSDMPKHAHLRFYTQGKPARVLCYVDTRRFGKDNVLRNLSDKAFNKPICEALLNQKFFNGVGNYLRAEILHRSNIPPFEKARTVLEELQRGLQGDPGPLAPKGSQAKEGLNQQSCSERS